jgi:hypothetical protein
MGEEMLPADANNRLGYFEDLDFVELNRRMLAAVVPVGQRGHSDWGWTEEMPPSGVDTRLLEGFVDAADELVAYRRSQAMGGAGGREREARCWGWKDPRTTVLLDFWNARIPDARYLFIYRAPWDVADSMQRIGAAEFLRHPEFAYEIWRHYNHALLAFAQAHPDRTLVVSAAGVMRDPHALLELVESRLHVRLDHDRCEEVAHPSLMIAADSRSAGLGAAADPACTELFLQLEDVADLPSKEDLPARLAPPASTHEAQVSIIIPCFNDGLFLLEAIASAERAVSVPYELIVVNDGSVDPRTLEILGRLRQAGYRVIDQENLGLAEARNRGIREARCPQYVPLDADNRLRPGFVEAALGVLQRDPAVMAVYGDRREFGLRSGRVAVGVPDLNRLLCGNYIDACAVIRRGAWLACGGYDRQMPIQGMEDWEFWLAMLECGFALHRVEMEAFDYRVRPDSMLAKTLSPEAQETIERYVVAKHAPFYLQHLRRQVDRLEAIADVEAKADFEAGGLTPNAAAIGAALGKVGANT